MEINIKNQIVKLNKIRLNYYLKSQQKKLAHIITKDNIYSIQHNDRK